MRAKAMAYLIATVVAIFLSFQQCRGRIEIVSIWGSNNIKSCPLDCTKLPSGYATFTGQHGALVLQFCAGQNKVITEHVWGGRHLVCEKWSTAGKACHEAGMAFAHHHFFWTDRCTSKVCNNGKVVSISHRICGSTLAQYSRRYQYFSPLRWKNAWIYSG